MSIPAILPTVHRGVLVASPSTALREQVRRNLEREAGLVQEVNGGADALVKLESGQWQLLFLDRRLLDLDAEELTEIIKVRFPGTEVVMLDSDSDSMLPWLVKGRTGSTWMRSSQGGVSGQEEETRPALEDRSIPKIDALPGM